MHVCQTDPIHMINSDTSFSYRTGSVYQTTKCHDDNWTGSNIMPVTYTTFQYIDTMVFSMVSGRHLCYRR